MNAVGAWKITKGDRRIVVAVVDSGLVLSHPDIAGSKNLLPGYNFVTQDGRRNDPSDLGNKFHGTHVAGTIGVVGTNNARGISGINWEVSLLPVRVFNKFGGAGYDDVADGILWAAGLPVPGTPANPSPADVINLSFGTVVTDENKKLIPISCSSPAVQRMAAAIERAHAAGAVIVAAAGNETRDVAGVPPANCPGVISVAAHDAQGRLTRYSNFGNVSIMAPGGDTAQFDKLGQPAGVWSVVNNDPRGFAPWSGTSMAAPHVAGAIALALAKHEEWRHKPDLIAAAIHDTAVPVIPGACPNPCGPGQLDAERLMEYTPAKRENVACCFIASAQI